MLNQLITKTLREKETNFPNVQKVILATMCKFYVEEIGETEKKRKKAIHMTLRYSLINRFNKHTSPCAILTNKITLTSSSQSCPIATESSIYKKKSNIDSPIIVVFHDILTWTILSSTTRYISAVPILTPPWSNQNNQWMNINESRILVENNYDILERLCNSPGLSVASDRP